MKALILLLCALLAGQPLALGHDRGAAAQQTLPLLDTMVVENVPPVPTALVEEADRYTGFRAALLSSWHPTRREMLITTRFADTDQVHLVRSPAGARTQLTFFKDRVDSASWQPVNGNYFVFAKDRGGDEFFQLYRFDIATKAVTLLTDGTSRNTGAVWSHAGNTIAYGSTRRNGKDVDIYTVDPSDPATSTRRLAELTGGGWAVLDWSPDDRQLLVAEEISANESYLWLFDTTNGARKLVTHKSGAEPVAYEYAQFAPAGDGIYAITDRNCEFKRLAYINLKTLSHKYLTSHITWDIDDIALSWDGLHLAFVSNEDGRARLHLLDTKTNLEMPLPALPAGQITDLRWHKNNKDLGFIVFGARSPADIYSLDIQSSLIERWTQSETGMISCSSLPEPELIRWTSSDGKSISGFLYKPPERFAGKRPVIINIHGGPEGQARPFFLGRSNYYLNELGVAIIYPNVRGSSGFGKSFLKLDNGLLRRGAYRDIGTLLDWIKGRDDLDADRVMVTGGSYGGHMTLAVSCFYPERIRCAVDVVGPSNLVTFLENTEDYRRDLRRVEYGDERDPEVRAFLLSIAPMNNVSRITKPLFVVQGKNDPRVPASEALQLVAALKANHTPAWFLMANDEGHGFRKKSNSDYLFYATVMFIRKYLLD